MKKLNLQLFTAYDPNSIVDYLKKSGQDSSYSARAVIADELGIKNYTGSGEQNTQMLKMLKDGAGTPKNTPSPTPLPNATGDATPTPIPNATGTPTVTTLSDTALNNKNATFTPSDTAKGAGKKQEESLNDLNSIATPTISQETMNILNSTFTASSAYTEAMNFTKDLFAKVTSGRTSYTDQIKNMMNQIQNREKFSYDVENDTLFQQALASAMGSGKQAMQDTIGQASALTGGYASTYATSAGNQAYNAYIEDAYNNLPEYYQMAMEAYQMEGQEMYNQLAMLNDADATEYNRTYDAWNASFATAQNMYNQEYGAYQDSITNAYNSANLQLEQQGMAYDQAFNNYTANSDYYNTLYQNEYTQWQNELDNAYRYDVMDNNNAQAELDRTHQSEENKKDRELEVSENQLNRQHDNDQFVARYDINGDGKVDASDNIEAETGVEQKYFLEALEAYNTGGPKKLSAYLDSLTSLYNDTQLDTIAEYVGGHGDYTAPYTERKWEVVSSGGGHIGKLDDNAVVKDDYGNKLTIKELYEALIEEGMDKNKAKGWVANLQKELGI